MYKRLHENVGYSRRLVRGTVDVVGKGWRPTSRHWARSGSADVGWSYRHKWPTLRHSSVPVQCYNM